MRTKGVLLAPGIALATALFAVPALGEVDVAVSVGEPGFYGRIDLRGAPPPSFVYAQPLVVVETHEVEPLYLRVPLGYASDWKRHCGEYHACSRPTYFVQDNWYTNVYAPHYRKQHGHSGEQHGKSGEEHGKSQGRGHGHGHDH